MKNDFLNDDWLKEELAEEHLNNDNFSMSVMEQIQQQQSTKKNTTNRSLFTILTLVAIGVAYLLFQPFVTLLANSNVNTATELFSIHPQQFIAFTNSEITGLFAFILIFILTWSFEDFDLI